MTTSHVRRDVHSTFNTINRARAEVEMSAFLTPWGIRECKRMGLDSIGATFGEVAREFWAAVQAGRILFPQAGTTTKRGVRT